MEILAQFWVYENRWLCGVPHLQGLLNISW